MFAPGYFPSSYWPPAYFGGQAAPTGAELGPPPHAARLRVAVASAVLRLEEPEEEEE